MKVIDLYNIIVEGKVPPKKISYNGVIYVWDENKYLHFKDEYSKECCLLEGLVTEMCLNDYIEIIKDKPEKIEKIDLFDNFTGFGKTPMTEQLRVSFQEINEKFDELTDKLNYLLEKSDKE